MRIQLELTEPGFKPTSVREGRVQVVWSLAFSEIRTTSTDSDETPNIRNHASSYWCVFRLDYDVLIRPDRIHWLPDHSGIPWAFRKTSTWSLFLISRATIVCSS